MLLFRRKDGKRIKGLEDVERLMPLFMPSREGSVNNYLFNESAKYFDAFIKEKQRG